MIRPFGFIYDPPFPITLDESKTSYEFLARVLKKLDEVIALANKLETDVNKNISAVNAMLQELTQLKLQVEEALQELDPANLITDDFGTSQIKGISQLTLTNILQPILNLITDSTSVANQSSLWGPTGKGADVFCCQFPTDWLISQGADFLYDIKIPYGLPYSYNCINAGIYAALPTTPAEWNNPITSCNLQSKLISLDFLNINSPAITSDVIYIALRMQQKGSVTTITGGGSPHAEWNSEFIELLNRPGPVPVPLKYYSGTWSSEGVTDWKSTLYTNEFNISMRYLPKGVAAVFTQNPEVKEE